MRKASLSQVIHGERWVHVKDDFSDYSVPIFWGDSSNYYADYHAVKQAQPRSVCVSIRRFYLHDMRELHVFEINCMPFGGSG